MWIAPPVLLCRATALCHIERPCPLFVLLVSYAASLVGRPCCDSFETHRTHGDTQVVRITGCCGPVARLSVSDANTGLRLRRTYIPACDTRPAITLPAELSASSRTGSFDDLEGGEKCEADSTCCS